MSTGRRRVPLTYAQHLSGTIAFRLPLRFDAREMHRDVCRMPESSWTYKGYSSPGSYIHYRAHQQLELRGGPRIGGRAAQGVISVDGPFEDYGVLKRSPGIRRALGLFKSDLTAVNLFRLRAGGMMTRHVDPTLLHSGRPIVTVHAAVSTNPHVKFFVNRQGLTMRAGEVWSLNSELPHEVYNLGRADRVHLIAHVVYDDHFEALLAASDKIRDNPTPERTAEAAITARAALARLKTLRPPGPRPGEPAEEPSRKAAVIAQLIKMGL
jgi:hypothetical protein